MIKRINNTYKYVGINPTGYIFTFVSFLSLLVSLLLYFILKSLIYVYLYFFIYAILVHYVIKFWEVISKRLTSVFYLTNNCIVIVEGSILCKKKRKQYRFDLIRRIEVYSVPDGGDCNWRIFMNETGKYKIISFYDSNSPVYEKLIPVINYIKRKNPTIECTCTKWFEKYIEDEMKLSINDIEWPFEDKYRKK